MEKYQSPSLSMIPLYRNEGDPTRVVMDWKQAGTRIEHDLIQEGFNVKVFMLEEKEEQVVFGIIISEDRFSMPYYKEVFENVLENLAEPDNFTLNPSPDGTRAFYLTLNKEQVEVLELRTALESHEILSSPSRLTVPVGRAFSDTVESLDLRFFSCFYMTDEQDYTPGMTEVLLTGFLFRTNPKDVRFLFLDQGHVLESYYGLTHMFDPPTQTLSGCLQVIRWIQDEIILRLGAMEAKGAKSLDGYNASLRVDEQTYTRLLVFITPADELFKDQDFLTVLRMVREHGLMVGIHFFMQMSTPVPVTFLTKTTLCFKRAIDAETQKHRLVKNYQIKRGEHSPHFVNACYIEQSDIDTITSYLKENNSLKYMGLVKVQEERSAEEAPAVEEKNENPNEVMMFSFNDSTGETPETAESAKPSESPAAQWTLPEHLIHIPKDTGVVSRKPLTELKRRRITGYRTRFERIVQNSSYSTQIYRSAKRLRKNTILRSESILQRYQEMKSDSSVHLRRERPAASIPGYTETSEKNTPPVQIEPLQKETAAPAVPVQHLTEKDSESSVATEENKPSQQRDTVRKSPSTSEIPSRGKGRKPILPILLGCSLFLGGTYAILRQNNILQPITSYFPFSTSKIISGENNSKSPTPEITSNPTVMSATAITNTVESTLTPAPAAVSTSAPAILGPGSSSLSGTDTNTVPATEVPKNSSTPAPTAALTAAPTQIPVETSGKTVSANETIKTPAVTPSTVSTTEPAQGPTKLPEKSVNTAAPSLVPAAAPSAVPTTEPTQGPTKTPEKAVNTAAPSKEPAVAHSAVSTTEPAHAPTKAPEKNTYTAAQTKEPAAAPSAVPTTEPTEGPTKTPENAVNTAAPSKVPTAVPSITPTTKPAQTTPEKNAVTTAPTKVPAATSSTISTAKPIPNNTPEKAVSTVAPTQVPAAAPSTVPTAEPVQKTNGSSESSVHSKTAADSELLDLSASDLSERDVVPNKGASSTEINNSTVLEERNGNSDKGQMSVIQNAAQEASDMLMSKIPAGFKSHYSVGDKGEDVIRIKKRMMEMGYYSGSTFFNDRYNEYMANHVRTLQRLNNLPVTGEISSAELLLLFDESETR